MEQKASYDLDHSSLIFFHCPYIPTYSVCLQYSRFSLMFSFHVLPLEPSSLPWLQLCFLSYTQISVFSLRLSSEGYLHNCSSLLGISTLYWTGTKLNSSSSTPSVEVTSHDFRPYSVFLPVNQIKKLEVIFILRPYPVLHPLAGELNSVMSPFGLFL